MCVCLNVQCTVRKKIVEILSAVDRHVLQSNLEDLQTDLVLIIAPIQGFLSR